MSKKQKKNLGISSIKKAKKEKKATINSEGFIEDVLETELTTVWEAHGYELFSELLIEAYEYAIKCADKTIRVVNIEVPLFDSFGNLVSLRDKKRDEAFDGSDLFVDIDNIYFVLWSLWSAKCSLEVECPTVIGIREIVDADKLSHLCDNYMISLKDLTMICAENDFELNFLEKSVIMYCIRVNI